MNSGSACLYEIPLHFCKIYFLLSMSWAQTDLYETNHSMYTHHGFGYVNIGIPPKLMM